MNLAFSRGQAVLLFGLVLTSCAPGAFVPEHPEAPGERAIPRPTEHWLDEGAEGRNKADRRAWMREMHWAEPGLDWQQIELRNGEREMARRSRTAGGLSTSSGVSAWSEVGSRNQAGRMHCATLSPDGSKLYAGSSLGGVWVGNPDGTGWTPLGDNLYGGSRRIAVLPPEQVGGQDVIISATSANQIRVTRDLGVNWDLPAGLPNFNSIRGLEVLDDSTSTVLVIGRAGGNTKLWASTDHGQSFQVRWTAAVDGNSSIFVPRYGVAAANTVYLLHRGRLRLSTDSGFTFNLVHVLDASAADGHLVGCEGGAPTLYASLLVANDWKLHRSDDAGQSWSFVNEMDGYWSALEASSTNPSLVSYGGVDAWRSQDGGASFQRINGWAEYYSDPLTKLHADQQGIFCLHDPSVPFFSERWYYCTDGGIYLSTDATSSVTNLCLSGLGVSQYYSTLTSAADNRLIAAGSQDQGYQVGSLVSSSGPGPSTNFNQVISGDYGHLTSSDGTHGLVYSTYPGFTLVQEGAISPILRFVDFPPGANHLWLPPVVADPLDPEAFFFLGDALFRHKRVGAGHWNTTQHSTQSFTASNASYLSAMAFAPSDSNRVYAVNNRGRFYRSDDHGVSWSLAAENGSNSHYFYGNALCVHPVDEDEAFAGGSGYSGAGVWRTTDGGVSWQALGTGLPSTLVYDLAYAGDGSGDVFAATEAGAFQWDRTDGLWHNVMEPGTPLTIYWSVEAVPDLPVGDAVMRFGTYGRGIWDYDVPIGTNGTWLAYDQGASSANTLELTSPTAPNLGSTIRLEMSGVQLESGPGWILAGRQRANLPALGGVQLVGQVLRTFPFQVNGTGGGVYELAMPNNALWLGTVIRFQAFAPDITGPAGYRLSQGLEAVFGI